MLKLIFIFIFYVQAVIARPVSYVDGWTVMTFNDHNKYSSLVHYTPSRNYSIGYKVEYWKAKEYWINGLNINYLVKKFNKKHSQRNIYFKSGFGMLYTDYKNYTSKKEYVSYGELAADWETRRQLISYSTKAIKSESVDNTFMQKARFGFAPYIADYGKIHTWLMYELEHMPENKDNLTSNFILRLFKSSNLLEVGIDENKNILLNFVKRF